MGDINSEILIELPWPPKQLNPNAKRRKHWRTYQPFILSYRTACKMLTNSVRARHGGDIGSRIASVHFCPPDRRKRDDDGMIGAFKHGRDGVADALGVDDHTFRPTYTFGEPVRHGKVIVSVVG